MFKKNKTFIFQIMQKPEIGQVYATFFFKDTILLAIFGFANLKVECYPKYPTYSHSAYTNDVKTSGYKILHINAE